jgi:hypothetical protein
MIARKKIQSGASYSIMTVTISILHLILTTRLAESPRKNVSVDFADGFGLDNLITSLNIR